MSNIRISKYEIFVKDINDSLIEKIGVGRRFEEIGKEILENILTAIGETKLQDKVENETIQNKSLLLIYEYDKMNDFAKVIAKNSYVRFRDKDDRFVDLWDTKYNSIDFFADEKNRIAVSKDFVRYCRDSNGGSDAYIFIFWALMVLTVDQTDAEKYLTLICDFATMFGMEKCDLQDIINVIKKIYGKDSAGYEYHNGLIETIFEDYISR